MGGVAVREMLPLFPAVSAESLRPRTRLSPITVGPLVSSTAGLEWAVKDQLGSFIGGVVVVSSGMVTVRFGPHSALPSPLHETSMS